MSRKDRDSCVTQGTGVEKIVEGCQVADVSEFHSLLATIAWFQKTGITRMT